MRCKAVPRTRHRLRKEFSDALPVIVRTRCRSPRPAAIIARGVSLKLATTVRRQIESIVENSQPGRRQTILFAGADGSGKTRAAGLLAQRLGLDLYRVDLASVVSKYIGETEKNLSALSDDLASREVILLFDEADALLGKRHDSGSAADRYANQETNFLLQRIEAFDGIVILTTNRRDNIDATAVRKMAYVVDFTEAKRR